MFVFYASFITILFYYLYFFVRVLGGQKKGDGFKRSVSVIICARNEADNLSQGLVKILQQDYPHYEVILVDDGSDDETQEIMQDAANTYPFVHFYRLDIDKNIYPGKKYALDFGIRKANNEIILVTDADCEPVGNSWIAKMLEPFDNKTDLVLGFGPYYKRDSIQNRVARYECIYTAIKYFSFAKAGIPYMGVGRNMAYKKQAFLDNNGFDSHIHVPSGDDDLFVREIAKKGNTKIQLDKASFMWSEAAIGWRAFVRQKHRHLSVGFYYKPLLKIMLGIDMLSVYTFIASFILLLITNKLSKFLIIILMCKLLVHTILFALVYRKMHYRCNALLTPLVDFLHIISYFYISIKVLINKTIIWR